MSCPRCQLAMLWRIAQVIDYDLSALVGTECRSTLSACYAGPFTRVDTVQDPESGRPMHQHVYQQHSSQMEIVADCAPYRLRRLCSGTKCRATLSARYAGPFTRVDTVQDPESGRPMHQHVYQQHSSQMEIVADCAPYRLRPLCSGTECRAALSASYAGLFTRADTVQDPESGRSMHHHVYQQHSSQMEIVADCASYRLRPLCSGTECRATLSASYAGLFTRVDTVQDPESGRSMHQHVYQQHSSQMEIVADCATYRLRPLCSGRY
ncbi:hypothetical protein J6590_059620 [Homalodisca vitripennis]|nr:hypothetical protein J6590_059620 [Homalodisca vitripennis]